ncbi:MAG: WbuC family cupin fold metalloprotein [Bryobacteraceae bacterium]
MSVQLITRSLIDALESKASAAPRKRINHNFHSGPEDNPHRFLNVILAGSYVAPHRHRNPAKAETFVVLEGEGCIWTFDDAGAVTAAYRLGPAARDGWGIDLAPGIWHTVAAVSPSIVCFEVKPGPWDPSSDKEFAPWAPREGDAGAAAYMQRLLES